MTVVVNGVARQLPDGLTVRALLDELGRPAGRGTAVAVEGEVVPRADWSTTALTEGAEVEVLAAMQGG